MKRTTLLLLAAALIALFNGCAKMPNNGVPIYLQMDSVVVTTDPFTQGANTESITDIWAEAGSSNLGAYELPCYFPVLQGNSDVHFTLSAGIYESGLSGSRVIYPFYEVDTFTIPQAEPASTYSHIARFKYKALAKFPFIDSFEGQNGFSSSSTVSDTNTLSGYGSCAHIYCPPSDSDMRATMITPVDLTEGNECWVEIDYKNDVPFWIGIFGVDANGIKVSQNDIIYVTPKTSWRKLYLKIGQILPNLRNPTYALYLDALNINGTGGNVYFDNVKIVSY